MQQRRIVDSNQKKKTLQGHKQTTRVVSKATISANRAFESVTYPQPDPSGSCGFRWPAAALSYRHCGDTRAHTHTLLA